MYYLVYGFFYLLSLLPYFVIYAISDGLTFLVYNVFGYRKQIVLQNLTIAFPEKTLAERKKIAKQFYKNFIDTLLETIKMISLSEAEFERRCTVDIDASNALAAKGKSIHFHGAHQMNWEYANWVFVRKLAIPMVGIYMPIKNNVINKIFYSLRARYNTVLVSTKEFKSRMHNVFNNQYALALAVDQNPGNLENSYWVNFFTKASPFVTGPDRGAIKNNAAVVFVKFIKTKRGYYHFATKVVVENANECTEGELTVLFRDFLEETIRESPDNYLWSHRRWKHIYQPYYEKFWIDKLPPL
jgi:Kdo2-lipid IVA lauroyltransferase/acyltransferase